MNRRNIRKVVVIALLGVGALVMVLPFWFMVVLSLETPEEIASIPPKIIPSSPTLENYNTLFEKLNFGRNFLNSTFLALVLTGGQILLCSIAGYAFARFYFPLKNLVFLIFLSVIMLPGVVIIIPRYLLIRDLGLINTLTGIIITELFSEFGIFLYRQHFMSMPLELEEAAIVDGASPWQIFWKVAMPLSNNITLSFGLLVFMYAWNLFLWPLIVITSPDKRTLPIALAYLQGRYSTNWGIVMAGAAIATIPPIIMFIFTQKRLVEGIAFTGMKQ